MPLSFPRSIIALSALACLRGSPARAAGEPQSIDYGRDVRPILSEHCFYCHGQDATKRQAKLRLDTEEGQHAKKAVIPGHPEQSELVRRVFAADPEDLMPPEDAHRALTDPQKEILRRWVAEGAPFTGHWAFQRVVRPDLPSVRLEPWTRDPVDRFVLAHLEQEGLTPSPEAGRETLIRRVTLDLTGLPPTTREIDDFLADRRPDAYERVVDRLLASPHYGERMALPWLDAARYADSNGFQQDGDTFQWIWRDWVVDALNSDMPFDQFTVEQLAGDLLPKPTREQLVATAFNRNHMLNGEGGAIAEEQRHVILFDRVDTTATTWLALTMACAQCHDHKYDPVTQRDYYSLLAAFNNVPENGLAPMTSHRVRPAEPVLDLGSPEQKARVEAWTTELARLEAATPDHAKRLDSLQLAWEAQVAGDAKFPDAAIRELATLPRNAVPGPRESRLGEYFRDKVLPGLSASDPAVVIAQRRRRLDAYKADDYPRVMVMADTRPRDTFILDRGSYESPGTKVSFSTPAFLPPLPSNEPRNRLGLARWLVSRDQPLTARVVVNRQWQMFFGLGLVKTSEDFGVQSEAPILRTLLDWLAAELMEPTVVVGGRRAASWSLKHLHRLIVTSATYRQASGTTPALRERDPENRLYARGPRFRLPSPLIRDQALASSGLLAPRVGGKPVYPYQPPEIWDSLAITKERDFSYPQSHGADLYRRSLYTFWRRTVAPANLFDASARNVCKVRLGTTNTPLHALTVLNDPTFVEAARVLAQRALQLGDAAEDAKLGFAFRRILGRRPQEPELAILRASLAKQRGFFQRSPSSAKAFLQVGESARDRRLDPVEHAAMAATCLAIYNLDEALTKP